MAINEILKIAPFDCANCELASVATNGTAGVCEAVAAKIGQKEAATLGGLAMCKISDVLLSHYHAACRREREQAFVAKLPDLPRGAYYNC